jgi:hypothetical protein
MGAPDILNLSFRQIPQNPWNPFDAKTRNRAKVGKSVRIGEAAEDGQLTPAVVPQSPCW